MAVADLVSKGYGGYQGWSDAAADADFAATGGSGKYTVKSPSQTVVDQARQLNEFQVQANQPAIQSFQASMPETQQRFATERTRLEGEKDPLKARYQSILDDLTRRQGVEETSAIKRTANEFGKRGIPLSSGVYANEEAGALSPIRSEYATLSRDTGLAQEASLKGIDDLISGLAGQETDSLRLIQNAIAQLQSGNPASSVQGALSLISQQEQARQAAQQIALQQAQLSAQTTGQQADRTFRDRQYENIDLPAALAQIRNINSQISNRGSSTSSMPSLDQIFG